MYLDEEKGIIKEMLRSHKASLHKSSFHLAQMQQCKADQCSKEDTSTQSSPIKTRRASLETAAKFLTCDDIKRLLFCEQEGK